LDGLTDKAFDFVLTTTTTTTTTSTTPTTTSAPKTVTFGFDEVRTHGEHVQGQREQGLLVETHKFFTMEHWLLDPMTKMRVHLAKQFFSDPTFASFKKITTRSDENRWKALVVFMRAVRNIYLQVFFSKHTIKSLHDPRITALMKGVCFFELWHADVQSTFAHELPSARNKHFISPKTYFQLRMTVAALCQFLQMRLSIPGKQVKLCLLSQSDLESFFGYARSQERGTGKLTEVSLQLAIGKSRFTTLNTMGLRQGQKRQSDGLLVGEQLTKRTRRSRQLVAAAPPR
jgi:hypothetical protein